MKDASQSYGASPATWDHRVLPATRHRWTCPASTLSQTVQTGRYSIYLPLGMKGWVDLGVVIYLEMVYLYADIRPAKY